jgi:hypothetical protein
VTTSFLSEPTEKPSSRRRWLPRIIAIAALIAVAVVLLVRLDVIGGSGEPSAAERTEAVNAELTRRIVTHFEQTPATEHQGHGGAKVGTDDRPAKTVCEARVYGYEPETAATADEVDTVYGFHMCGMAEPGRPWDWATKMVAPMVMRFNTQPPTVEIAESTEKVSYRDRVKQLIPERYQKQAFEGALTPDDMAELRRRYDDAAGL